MIALVRKNLTFLISKHNSFVCKSHDHVSFSLPLHFFSTSRERKLVESPAVYDVLVDKHHFSPQVASLVASDLARCRSPQKADSILSFLKESGFSSGQLEKIVKYKARMLSASVEDDIRLKIKIFQDFGFSSEDIAKMISSNSVILNLSAKNRIVPQLSLLKGLLGSDDDVVRLVRSSAWFMTVDLDKTLLPNVEFLKSCGIPMERILTFLFNFPRCFLIKPEIMRKSVEKAKELGVSPSSKMFIYAVRVMASMSKETWELKLQAFRNLGFSDSDILTMFRKAPPVFCGSMKKIRNVKELLLATGKFNISSIVSYPSSLGCSIQKRLKPRLQVLGILESKNLIKKWPTLGTIYTMTNDKFYERFIIPYSKELGKLYAKKSYVKRKREMKIQTSA